MKNLIAIFIYTLSITVLLTSCNSNKSLQEYYVEKQNSDNFIAIDLPASLINLNDDVSGITRNNKDLKKVKYFSF